MVKADVCRVDSSRSRKTWPALHSHSFVAQNWRKRAKKKKSGIFQGTNYNFLFKAQKNKEKVFIAKSFFPLSYMYQSITSYTVKIHIKNLCFGGSGWFLFLFIWCFLQNQLENVLKVFLKLFLNIKYYIEYQQMNSMCKHNILINGWN